jgi:hypothetical protein
VGPHESMTCGVHGIYLKFGSFNGIDPIVPNFNGTFNFHIGFFLGRHLIISINIHRPDCEHAIIGEVPSEHILTIR